MKKENKAAASILRQKAEEQLKKQQVKPSHPATEADMLKLIHELQVHQIELELQNEELILANERAMAATEKYTELYDFAPSGYFTLNKAGKIIELNLHGAKMLGKERSKLINSQFDFFIKEDSRNVFNTFLDEIFHGKNNAACDVPFISNGDITWYVHLTGVISDNEEQCRITAIDITERKKAEDDLRTSKLLLENIINNAPVRIFWKDKNLVFRGCNIEFAKDAGFLHPDEIIGKNDYQMVWHKQAELYRGDDLEVIESGKPKLNIEEPQTTPDGNNITVLTNKIPLRSAEGKVEGILGIYLDITQRKHDEDVIKQHNLFLQTLINTIPAPIFFKDIHGRYLSVNKSFENFYGIIQENITGKTVFEIAPPEFANIYYEKDMELFQNPGMKQVYESKVKTVKGKILDVIFHKAAFLDSGNRVQGLIGIILDISERKKTEMALKESELFANTIANTTPALLYLYDFEQAKNIWTNEAHKCFFEDMKKDSSSFNYDEISQFTHPDDFRELLRLVDEMFNNHSINHYETEHRLKWKGTWKWMKLFVSVFKRDLEGKPVQILGALFDIDDIKKAEQHLFEAKEKAENSKRLLAKIAENYPNSFISLIEKDLTISFSGGQEFKRQNLNPDDYDGMTVEQVFGEKAPIVKANYLKTFQGEETTFELFIKNQYQLYKTVPLYDENKLVTRILVVVENITERKKAEEELIKAKEKAEESDRLKSAFLANMSHEIRTPMNGILGFAELLKEPDLSVEKQMRYIGIIEKSGARMLTTINDIIDFSKIEAGLMEVTMSETNINSQLEDIYTFFKPETDARGLALSCHKTLPDDEVNINTDAEKLYAILTNLVKNAIKFTPKGSVEFGYKIVETLPATSLQFYVNDTGIGIPPNRLEAVFDRFIQADVGDKRAFQGSGLGLTISKAYVEMLGGKIWVESHEENPETGLAGGTTFYFIIPLVFGHEQNRNPENNQADMPAEFDSFPDNLDLKILIVEDEEDSNAMLAAFLQNISREILIAKTGFEAIELCRRHPDVDLVLMDMKMPDMNGYEATRIIRTFNRKVVIVAQTAYALIGDREKALEAGCDDYITKPINKKELLWKIQKFNLNKTTDE